MIDIEDLRVFGEEETGCSFYSARALAETSQLILCPYNYIFDPSIREAVISGSLENSVVIVDEAHNVEQVLLGKLFCSFHASIPKLKSLFRRFWVYWRKSIRLNDDNEGPLRHSQVVFVPHGIVKYISQTFCP